MDHQSTPQINFDIFDNDNLLQNGNFVTDDGEQRYSRGDLLGSGTYGMVYLARDLSTNQQVVVKMMKRFTDDDQGLSSTSLRETSLLKELKHEYIVELLDHFFTKSMDFCLVFGHCEMDLQNYIKQNKEKQRLLNGRKRSSQEGVWQSIDAPLLQKWTFQMVQAICFMHSRRILHRDLKPPNILITKDLDIKIGDLGLGKEHRIPIHTQTTEIVTLWYRCPELMLGTKLYAGKVDIWSLGCIVAEMARGEPLFDGMSEWECTMMIFQFWGTPKAGGSISKLKFWDDRIPKFKAMADERKMAVLNVKGDAKAFDLIKVESICTLDIHL